MVGVLTMHLTGIVAFHKPMIKITKRYHKVASKIVFGAFFTAASLSFWSNWSTSNLASWIKVGFRLYRVLPEAKITDIFCPIFFDNCTLLWLFLTYLIANLEKKCRLLLGKCPLFWVENMSVILATDCIQLLYSAFRFEPKKVPICCQCSTLPTIVVLKVT